MTKSHPLSLHPLASFIVTLAGTHLPVFANEVRLPLVQTDDYAVRSVLIRLRTGNRFSGCEKLSSYTPSKHAITCRLVSGNVREFQIRDIIAIEFPISVKNDKGNPAAQQSCWSKIVVQTKERVSLLIPENLLDLSEHGILLSSNWTISSGKPKSNLFLEAKTPGSSSTDFLLPNSKVSITMLEPSSLHYDLISRRFVFAGQYSFYQNKSVCSSGGGSKGSGKGFGNSGI